jgi:hypothetical protein
MQDVLAPGRGGERDRLVVAEALEMGSPRSSWRNAATAAEKRTSVET